MDKKGTKKIYAVDISDWADEQLLKIRGDHSMEWKAKITAYNLMMDLLEYVNKKLDEVE